MDDHEFEALAEAMTAEVDRKFSSPAAAELTARVATDDATVVGLVGCSGPHRRATFLSARRDDDGEIVFMWADDYATELFARYMAEEHAWSTPTEGAVTPDLSAFFAGCDPEAPALLHWAHWLRRPHADDGAHFTYDQQLIEMIVDALIQTFDPPNPEVAELMRRAVRGESVGWRDPDQFQLF
jgi:hypothetical protein